MSRTSNYFYRLWETGQEHLAAGRYVAARTLLERAAAMAWRTRDAASLAQLYLPLLEARRQIRLRAVEGLILIGGGAQSAELAARRLRDLTRQKDATLLLPFDANVKRLIPAIAAAARRTGACIEFLLLFPRCIQTLIAAFPAADLTSKLPIFFTQNPDAPVPPSTDIHLVLPLPPPDQYSGRDPGLGALARETLLIAWEALALRWQARHPLPRNAGPWDELHWLQQALRIDPACEPVTMRLIALAEALQRRR